jgi:hypothetical protein
VNSAHSSQASKRVNQSTFRRNSINTALNLPAGLTV